MKVRIDDDEYYPFHFLTDKPTWGQEVGVDEATVERWRRVLAEFEQVQDEMGKAVGR